MKLEELYYLCSSIYLLSIKIIVKQSAFICQSTWTLMFIMHPFHYTLKYSISKLKKSTSMSNGLFIPFGDKIYGREWHLLNVSLLWGGFFLLHKTHSLTIPSSFHGIGIIPVFLMKKLSSDRWIKLAFLPIIWIDLTL